MSAVFTEIGDGSSVLSTDANPNSSSPPMSRQFSASLPTTEAHLYAVATSGTAITLKVWFYDPTMSRWFSIGAGLSVAADTVADLGVVPRDVMYFVQVTLNVGVKHVGIGSIGAP